MCRREEWGCVKGVGSRPYKLGEWSSRGTTTNKVRDQQRTRRRVCGQTPPKRVSRLIKSPWTRLSPFPYTSLCYRILAALYYHYYHSHTFQWHLNPLPPLGRLPPPPLPRRPPSRLKAPRRPRRLLPLRQPAKVARRRRSAARSARRLTLHTSTRVSCLPRSCQIYAHASELVLKQVHPDTGISNKAMAILNSFVNDIFERIATEASSELPFNPLPTALYLNCWCL